MALSLLWRWLELSLEIKTADEIPGKRSDGISFNQAKSRTVEQAIFDFGGSWPFTNDDAANNNEPKGHLVKFNFTDLVGYLSKHE